METTTNWWNNLYDDLLAEILLDAASDEETNATTDFLIKHLELDADSKVFDQCCGTGRISLALQKRGIHAFGVDLIESYIRQAQSSAADQALDCQFESGDAYEYSLSSPAHAAFNWWTSFGYAESKNENVKMIQRAYESIVSGGKYALDFMNVPHLLKNFLPYVVTRVMRENGELTLIRESQLDLREGTILKTWNYITPEGDRTTHNSTVRLYNPWELKAMFEEVGFQDVELIGDLDGSALNQTSQRCIAIGRKP